MSLVDIAHLSRNFGSVRAVDDISFNFDAGDIFGFIGPNGAGKSTTMRILATLDLPSDGDCRIAGLSSVNDAEEVRRLIGYMPDSYGAYPNMTVHDYLDFFARAHGLRGERRNRSLVDIIDFCQLGGLLEKPVTTLSKGMKQRLCLGRCLVHDPQVLILDEPSAGLDPRARIEFRDLLRILAAQGKAILISSHILAELEELCHAVAIIEQGKLIATGRVDEITGRSQTPQTGTHEAIQADRIVECAWLDEHELTVDQLLAEQPEVRHCEVDGNRAELLVGGGTPAQAALLKRLLDAGLPIYRFSGRERRLEDCFMELTEGKVQ